MDGGLREKLIGAWKLVDVVEEPVDGSPLRRPHGERPVGLILYTPDGYMSAQIMERDRGVIASPDWSALTSEEYAEEARGYFAYCGSFEVDEVGSRQPRVLQLDGDALELSSAAAAPSRGALVITRLSWERARTMAP
jgi:hypothetical protein